MKNDPTPILTAARVETIFRECLVSDAELPDALVVEMITCTVGLHKERLEGHREEIAAMLHELPVNFRKGSGDGWSFLQACEDRHGNQWTGLHRRMDELFALGIATEQVTSLVPREMWPVLPGGMPYFMVN